MQKTSKTALGLGARVFVAEDEPDTLNYLRQTFEGFPGFKVVGSACSGEELLHGLRAGAVDLLFLDIYLKGNASGLDLIEQIKQIQSGIKILVATGKGEKHEQESLFAGANGFLLKPFQPAELWEAVATVLGGKLYYNAGVIKDLPSSRSVEIRPSPPRLPKTLTPEDRAYLHSRLAGKSDEQIAKDLDVKMETISQRRYRISQRLGLEVDIETFLTRLWATEWQTLFPGQEAVPNKPKSGKVKTRSE